MCVLDNREVRKGWEPVKQSVAAVFEKHGAKVLTSKRWDERRLGYPMRGQLRGTFLLTYFEADTQNLVPIRRDLQFNEAVMRFLTLQCDEVPETAYEPEAEFDVNAIPVDDAPEVEEPAAEEPAKDGEAKDGDAKDGDAKDGEAKDGEAKDGEAKDGEADGEKAEGDGESAEAGAAEGEAASEASAEAKTAEGEAETKPEGDN